MGLSDSIFEKYLSAFKVAVDKGETVEVKRILRPKRVYRRPDLQRLANRWYGMIDTGKVHVRFTARPTFRTQNFALSYPVRAYERESYYSETSMEIRHIELDFPVIGWERTMERAEYDESKFRLFEIFDIEVERTLRRTYEQQVRTYGILD